MVARVVMGRWVPAGLALLVSVVPGVAAPVASAAAVAAPTAPTIPLASQALAAAPVAHTWDATDGVLLWWTWEGADRPHAWRVVRTVDGATKSVTVEGWLDRHNDVDLKPGQAATYELTGVDASGAVVTATSSATGSRDAVEWQQPAVANSTIINGPVNRTDNTSWPGPDASSMHSLFERGLTSIGSLIRVGHLPVSGRVTVSSQPTGDEVRLEAPGICPPSAPVTGTGVIGTRVYTAWGTFREISATFDIRCGTEELVQRIVVRQESADLVPRVWGAATTAAATPGQLATATATLTNTGAGSAVMGPSRPAGGAKVVKDGCAGQTLASEQSCTVTMSFDTTGLEPGYHRTSFNTPVAGQPDTHSTFAIEVRSDAAPPTVRLTGLGPGITVLRWTGGSPGVGELAGYVVERSIAGGPWLEVERPAPNMALLEDRGVKPGTTASYRVRTLSTTGELSEPSAVVNAKTPESGLVSSLFSGVTASSTLLEDAPMLIPQGKYKVTPWGVAVTPDRKHLVLTTNVSGRHELLLTQLDGSNPRVVLSSAVSDDWFAQPHVSPDGRLVAFQWRGQGTIGVADLATGAFRSQNRSGTLLGWSADGRRLLLLGGQEADGAQPATGLRWADLDGTGWARIPGAELARDGSASRTGDVVWSEGTSGSATLRMLRSGASVPVTVLGPLACAPRKPVFDPTGTKVAVEIFTGCGWAHGAYALDLAGGVSVTGPGIPMAQLSSDVSYRWLTTRSAAPTASITIPATTAASTTAALTFSDPDDPVGGLTGSCSLDGGGWAPCGPRHALSGLSGGSHTLAVRVSDPAGNVSPTVSKTWHVDATPPTVALGAVASPLFATTTTLTMAGADSGGSVASYDVRERYAGPGGGFSGYVYPSVWQRLTSPRLTVKLTQGFTYCFSARARDAVGNVSPWTAERCTVVVLDDRAFGASKVARGSLSAYVFGTYSKTLAAGAYLSKTGITSRRVGVIVTTCSYCGPAEVWIGRTRLGVISTTTTTAAYRRVIWLPKTTTLSGTLVVKATTSRPVIFDGVLVLK